MPISWTWEGKDGSGRNFRVTEFAPVGTERILEASDRTAIIWDTGGSTINMAPGQVPTGGAVMGPNFFVTDNLIWLRCTHWPLTAMSWWLTDAFVGNFRVLEIW